MGTENKGTSAEDLLAQQTDEAQAHAVARGDFIEEPDAGNDDGGEDSGQEFSGAEEGDIAGDNDGSGDGSTETGASATGAGGEGGSEGGEGEGEGGEAGAGAGEGEGEADPKNHMMPKYRFDEVNERAKRATERVAELEAKLKAREELEAGEKEPGEKEADTLDVEESWNKYHDLMEDGELDEAKAVLSDIRKAEREQTTSLIKETLEEERKKAEDEKAKADLEVELAEANVTAGEILKALPALDNPDSVELNDLIVYADALQASRKLSRSDALIYAAKALHGYTGAGKPPAKTGGGKDGGKENLSQREIAAKVKNAKAADRQPPRMEKGASNRSTPSKIPVSEMTDEQFEAYKRTDAFKNERGDAGLRA